MSRKAARNSYFPSAGAQSPSLRRARAPFFYRNLITGTLILGFAVTVYGYSIRAVKQEDFSGLDVRALEEEERSKRQTSKVAQAVVDAEASIVCAGPLGSRREEKNVTVQHQLEKSHYPLAWVNRKFPGRSSGQSVIIQEAPSIDRPSSMRDRRI